MALLAAPEPLARLCVRDLTAFYAGTAQGVSNIDLDIRRGEFVVVAGRHSAGKTTLLRALAGQLPRQSGEIRWNGQVVQNLTGLSDLSGLQDGLLIIDDLSAALDARAERGLWDWLIAHNLTCLAASNRRVAWQRADRIVVLRKGVIEAEGRLAQVLETSDEMRWLWENG
ncbi:MAG: ATP-binding cassette domain-containing protein [Anaerolineae bacterium]|nr:ATP-binding cassette domain-containing protein [Anaerolineae bacterium]